MLIVGLALLSSGCGALASLRATPTPSPTPTPVPTPTPSPTPVPVVAVSAPTEAKRFWAHIVPAQYLRCAVEDGAQGLADLSFKGRAAAVLYWTGGDGEAEAVEALLARGVPVVVFAPEDAAVPAGAVCVRALTGAAATDALEAAIAYPPHDTLVRLLALFETRESDARTAWQAGVEAGRVYVKGVYYVAEAEETAGEWMAGRLEAYYEGMVDGVYAETAGLAVAAAEAMLAAGRADMEIFCADCNDALLALMEAHPALIPFAYGVDEAAAAQACLALAERLIAGETVENAALTACPITPAPIASAPIASAPATPAPVTPDTTAAAGAQP